MQLNRKILLVETIPTQIITYPQNFIQLKTILSQNMTQPQNPHDRTYSKSNSHLATKSSSSKLI